ncbi:MAG: phenylalanine--tRNA ligase subunit beta [Candidatus Roizmanbacteria bacterium]|nr:phenylalanine--tRNA ligase subunit beta [Candidatus Roizmanbacteria bacterium]
MNILVPHSWLTEYVKTDAKPREIARLLSLHSASVEQVIEKGDDLIYDIEITTNRIDMAGIVGLEREVAAVLNQNNIAAEYKELVVSEPEHITESLPITIKNDPALCRRILGVVIDTVQMGESPDWIKERLEKSGVRSLNTIVDITNYVMLETGHPTHVFDYDRIKTNTLIIRPSKKGEHITTFEGKNYTLPGDDIAIDDGTGEIIDLPGIAGTKNSVVTKDTKRILFFTENNDAYRIRRTCMTLGIHTYASNINKNRPDPETAKIAMLRGIQLYREVAKGTVASKIDDQYEKPADPSPVIVSIEKMVTYLGRQLPTEKVVGILTPLGFAVTDDMNNKHYTVSVPSWRRSDVTIEEDIIEEVARIFGYHNIESRVRIGEPVPQSTNTKYFWITKVKHALKYWGFTELYTSSLVSSSLLEAYGYDAEQVVRLRNPLNNEGVYLRPSLIPGVLDAVKQNSNYRESFSVFELSRVYANKQGDSQPIPEPVMITFALRESNLQKLERVFYKAKGIAEALMNELGITSYSFKEGIDESHPLAKYIHPTRQATIVVNEKDIGSIVEIQDLILVDIHFDDLIGHASTKKTYIPVPEHPPVIEDMTIAVRPNTFIGPLMDKIRTADKLVQDVVLTTRFEDKVTFRVTFQDPKKNLSDKEVSEIKEKILARI